ncbi:hypothetical protein MBLNU457_1167t1 [Dothideomycetes sp. NU457]
MPLLVTAAQTVGISTAFVAAGGIAATSIFDTPILQSQPASRSLPGIRWLFSRGSHIFPQAAFLSSACFVYLATNALVPGTPILTQLFTLGGKSNIIHGYLAASVLTFSIGPVTGLMIPTNFALIEKNEKKGGARSQASANQRQESSSNDRSASASVEGKGQAAEFTDLSGPQTQSEQDSTSEEDEKVRELLSKFGRMNFVRALLMVAGGVTGLLTALEA